MPKITAETYFFSFFSTKIWKNRCHLVGNPYENYTFFRTFSNATYFLSIVVKSHNYFKD